MDYSEFTAETIKIRIQEEIPSRETGLPGEILRLGKVRQDQISELTARLKESEADRAARLQQIIELTRLIKESEADRAAGPEVIPDSKGTANMKKSWLRYWVNRSYNIPFAGYFIRILTAIVNLPQIVRNINEYQVSIDKRFAGKAGREAAEEAHSLDAMYMSFENKFRGTRAETKRKLRVYLPLIHTLRSEKEAFSLLDIGCGRGEWLEMLREESCTARGIDINRAAIQQCLGKGLDVTEADVIGYLRGLERGSLDIITGFHLIEHLSFPTMVALFDEAFAVLKSGGMIIFETPNPTNILVSAYDFYRDPGHIRPLHPDTVNFIAEKRGFVRTGSYFVFDAGSNVTLIRSSDWKLDDINDYVRAPRDFALIGYKP